MTREQAARYAEAADGEFSAWARGVLDRAAARALRARRKREP